MMQPLLHFSFNGQETYFETPVKILTAEKTEDISTVFEELDQAIDQGYYAAGFVSYEAAPAFHSDYQVQQGNNLPLVWFGIYNKPSYTSSRQMDTINPFHLSTWKPSVNYQQYQLQMKKIKKAIHKGDTYQINYTMRLLSNFQGDPYSFYQQLKKNQQASYSAYLDIGDFQILSVSPELFFHVKNNHIVTKPMKGTIGRGRTYMEDQHLIHTLKHSEKDRAENVMIVDLLRNDLGRIAKTGTVKVSQLFDIESYPTVHQMTSTVEADLSTRKIYDWFQALFPCGSITGTPKIKTMEYIKELEDRPREIYCGAIGMISPEREAIFNVPIRTVIINRNQAVYGTGSGITWDSSPASEYEELKQKAKVLHQQRNSFSLLESIKLEKGNYPLLPFHLNRLSLSARYFNYPYKEGKVRKVLAAIAKDHADYTYKLRLLLHRDGSLSTDIKRIQSSLQQAACFVADKPVDKHNIFLYHKTTNRSIYQVHEEAENSKYFSALLWNEEGYITEFTTGNVAVESKGTFFTPPVSDGLLPGTFREKLMEDGKLTEKSIHLNELANYEQIWFINSVRGWVRVNLAKYDEFDI